MTVNGVQINSGEWFVVDKGVTYSVTTQGGYRALSGYTSNCMTYRATPMHLERSQS
jgi:hypothetical protein